MNSILLNSQLLTAQDISNIDQRDRSQWERDIFSFLQEWFSNSDAIAVNTSGSTGNPKSIELKKSHMVNSARLTLNYFHLHEQSKALLCLPASYIAGKMMLVRAIVGKLNLIAVKPNARPFEKVASIEFAAVTPYQLYNSFEDIDTRSIKNILVGGGAVDSKYMHQVASSKAHIYHSYAMTETCSHIALKKLNGADASEYFTVLPNVSISTDERQCLKILAPELSDSAIQTNDIADIKNPRQFKWLGRADFVINSGGVKIFPEEVEKKIAWAIAVPFFLASLPNEKLGEQVVLILETKERSEHESDKILKKLQESLSKFEQPKQIFSVPSFLYTSNGKLKRKATIEKYREQFLEQ